MELEGRRNEQVKELWGLEPHTVEEDLTTRFLLGPSNLARRFRDMGLHDGDKIGIEVSQFSSIV